VKAFLVVITIIAFAVSMVAQGPGTVDKAVPPYHGTLNLNWTIVLHPPLPATASGQFGNATFATHQDLDTGVSHQRFWVECEYTEFAAGTTMDVFVQEPTAPGRVFVGNMVVRNGSAAMMLLSNNVPKVIHGSIVTVNLHDGTPVMLGTF